MSAVLAADLAERDGRAVLEEWLYPGDGTTWRLVDGDYYKVSSDEDDHNADEDDAVAAALLLQRTLARFNPLRAHLSSHGPVRRRQAAERATARNDSSAPQSQAADDAPQASSDSGAAVLRAGPTDRGAGLSPAPRADRAGRSSSASHRSPRLGPTPPLDQRLRPFVNALADLVLADLLKYPPKS